MVSVATLLSTPLLSAAAHNPIFSFSLLLATLVILYRVWSACASDAQIATFHLLVNVVTVVKVFRQVGADKQYLSQGVHGALNGRPIFALLVWINKCNLFDPVVFVFRRLCAITACV